MDYKGIIDLLVLDVFLFAVLVGCSQHNDQERQESMTTQMFSLCESYTKQAEKHGDALDDSFVCMHSKDLSATFSKTKDGRVEILIGSEKQFFNSFRVRGRNLDDLCLIAVKIIMDGGCKSNSPSIIDGYWVYE